jgi:hypothetical protein
MADADAKTPLTGAEKKEGCCTRFPYHGVFAIIVVVASSMLIGSGLMTMGSAFSKMSDDTVDQDNALGPVAFWFQTGAITISAFVFLIGWQKIDPGHAVHDLTCCKVLTCCFGTCMCDWITHLMVWLVLIGELVLFGLSMLVVALATTANWACMQGAGLSAQAYVWYRVLNNRNSTNPEEDYESYQEEGDEMTAKVNAFCRPMSEFMTGTFMFTGGLFISVIAFIIVMVALTKYTDDRRCCHGNFEEDEEEQATDQKLVTYA